jgi:hypothetical protein
MTISHYPNPCPNIPCPNTLISQYPNIQVCSLQFAKTDERSKGTIGI